MISLNEFLTLNGIIVIVLLISYLLAGRRPTPPSKLNLKKKSSVSSSRKLDLSEALVRNEGEDQMKELTVSFEFEGRTWEAYEILELPAGSSWEAVEKAYRGKSINGKVENLLTAAYQELKKKLNRVL